MSQPKPHSATAPRLFLVRHGETAWSLSGQHTGLTDLPLTATGEAAAARLRQRLAGERFARVFTSPLQRARRTCELAGLAADAQVDPDLVEIHYGQYEGLTGAQIRERDPNWQLFRDGTPGGETPADAAARAERFLERFVRADADVCAFSSGHFIRLLAARWLGLPTTEAKHFYTATASVSVLGYEHGRADRVISLWNDVRNDVRSEGATLLASKSMEVEVVRDRRSHACRLAAPPAGRSRQRPAGGAAKRGRVRQAGPNWA